MTKWVNRYEELRPVTAHRKQLINVYYRYYHVCPCACTECSCKHGSIDCLHVYIVVYGCKQVCVCVPRNVYVLMHVLMHVYMFMDINVGMSVSMVYM